MGNAYRVRTKGASSIKIREIARVENYNPKRAQNYHFELLLLLLVSALCSKFHPFALVVGQKRVVKLNGNQWKVEAFVCLTVILLIISGFCGEVFSLVV